MEKRQRSRSPTQWHCPSLLRLKEGAGCTVSPSHKSKLLGSRWQKAIEDALPEGSSSSNRTLLGRVFSLSLYFVTPCSHVCAHACTHVHTHSLGGHSER